MAHAVTNVLTNGVLVLALVVIAGTVLPNLGNIIDAILAEGGDISRNMERNDR